MSEPAPGREPLALAIDLGTSAVKAAVITRSGRVVDRSRLPTRVTVGDGRRTARPAEWWQTVCEAVRDLAALPSVQVIALTGFMHTLVPIPADGAAAGIEDSEVLLPGDDRGVRREAEWADVPTAGARGGLARLAAWTDLNQAEVSSQRLRAVLPVKDYLRWRVTGVVGSDTYDAAATGVVDAVGSPTEQAIPLLRRLGVELPPLHDPGTVAGPVTASAAAQLGVPAGIPVVTGSGDWLTVCLGAEAAFPDRGVLYLGTSAAYGGFASAAALAEPRAAQCTAVAVNSGAVLSWAADLLADGSTDSLMRLAASASPDNAGVRYVPASGASREAAASRGQLIGLSLATRPADIAGAVVSGIADWIADLVGTAQLQQPVAQTVLCGGGATPTMQRILEQRLAVPLVLTDQPDVGLVGLAQLGFVGLDRQPALSNAVADVPP